MAKKVENIEKKAKTEVKTEKTAKKTAKTFGIVINGALNVRKEAKKGAEIVKIEPNGAKVEILGEENEFYKTPAGFVMKEFIQLEK